MLFSPLTKLIFLKDWRKYKAGAEVPLIIKACRIQLRILQNNGLIDYFNTNTKAIADNGGKRPVGRPNKIR